MFGFLCVLVGVRASVLRGIKLGSQLCHRRAQVGQPLGIHRLALLDQPAGKAQVARCVGPYGGLHHIARQVEQHKAAAGRVAALHHAVRWGNRALEFIAMESHRRFGGLTGLRFNIGRIEGGIKANVIAPSAEVRFGFRPLPSHDIDALHARFGACAAVGALERYEETFRGPSLPAGDIANAEERRLAARDLADALGLPIGNAVDFWTEASLFSQAGLTAFVYGPGDIAQAHTADEWVSLDQLQHYTNTIQRIFEQA